MSTMDQESSTVKYFYIKETEDFSLNYQYIFEGVVGRGRVLVIIVTLSNFYGIS